MQLPTLPAAPCALERIPNSDKIDGIEGMVGDTMEVNCVEASNPFQLKCVANGPGKARWDDYSPCNGSFDMRGVCPLDEKMGLVKRHRRCRSYNILYIIYYIYI